MLKRGTVLERSSSQQNIDLPWAAALSSAALTESQKLIARSAPSAYKPRLPGGRASPQSHEIATDLSPGPGLQGGHQPRHELVDPEHFLAALDRHDVAVAAQGRDLKRIERRRIFMPAEALAGRQQRVQMAHQWTDAVHAIDSGQMWGQRFVVGRRLGAAL